MADKNGSDAAPKEVVKPGTDESEEENEEEETMESLVAHLDKLGVNTAALGNEALEVLFKLRRNHDERAVTMGAYMEKRIALEKEFEAKFAAVSAKRKAILEGADEAAADGAAEAVAEGEAPAPPKSKLPSFWCTALRQHTTIENFIAEADVKALEYLTNIESTLDDDGEGFVLSFTFAPNPFFEESVLTKHYKVDNLFAALEEPMLVGVEGCSITWKEGKDLTKSATRRRKGRGQPQPRASFFSFFEPPSTLLSQAESQEEAEELMEQLEMDFQIGMMIRANIVPHAVLFFTGEAEADDSDEEYSDGEGDEDEDEDGEGEDSDEEDDKPAFNFDFTAAPADDKPAGEGDEKPECNQQ